MVPKKGDIVFIPGWGGIIGEVVDYDFSGKTLRLTWPNDLFWPNTTQPFYPVKPEVIEVLSPKEVLEKMSLLLKKRFDNASVELKKATENVMGGVRILSG